MYYDQYIVLNVFLLDMGFDLHFIEMTEGKKMVKLSL